MQDRKKSCIISILVQSNDVWMVDDFFIVENLDSFCFYL